MLGRDHEIVRVADLLAEDRPVVVVGEAGIGKTTLLRSVAAAAGRSVAEGGALSTLSWLQYLPLERALGESVSGDATAVAATVEARVRDGVLVLDDLHWADTGTLEVVGLLAGRVGLLAGVRRGDHAAPAVLDRLRAAGFVEITLAPLDRRDADTLVRSLRPDLGEAAVQRVIDRTGGNPLLLHELTASGEPTASLRLAIAARLHGLDPAGRDAFACWLWPDGRWADTSSTTRASRASSMPTSSSSTRPASTRGTGCSPRSAPPISPTTTAASCTCASPALSPTPASRRGTTGSPVPASTPSRRRCARRS
ncbi:MAG TPA: AAA family ATPase [Jatrophihabitans sp.]